MNNYDFKSLNDKEFEALACDLIGGHLGKKFERFKTGRDAGVDGRFFLSEGQEVVLQCKHWANTPISQLVNRLSKFERPKVAKLKPTEYFIAVTNSLSRRDKQKIRIALSPYINSESQIYGAEDLNDLLSRAKDIEQRHYKLWLHSSSVLSHIMNHAIIRRSEYTLEEIKTDTARYAITENHQHALLQLDSLGVIIITGEPGIGKTTLANHLCLHYVAQGYQFAVISDDIKEAEDILNKDTKQIFYFDDFLGRNYLDALNGHEGQKITQFIKRIANQNNKRFILTSRSTILNQGKLLIDVFAHANLQRNEYELKISSLSGIDKAHILYNQIWHSQLDPKYVNELYKDARYRNIISHKNYNPRLINYVTDATRLENIAPSSYWDFIEKSLNNPADIWDNPFTAQQDDFGRAIILLVVLHRQPISQNTLAEAYHEYLSLPGNQNLKGRSDFINNLKILTGSFLNRIVDGVEVKIDLFNPSIGDYVLQRYKSDPSALKRAFVCLRNRNALHTLKSLSRNYLINDDEVKIIINAILERSAMDSFSRADVQFVAELVRYFESFDIEDMTSMSHWRGGVRYVLQQTQPIHSTRDAFSVIKSGVKRLWVTDEEALLFVEQLAHFVVADEEVEDCWALISSLDKNCTNYRTVFDKVTNAISENISPKLNKFIDVDSLISEFDPGDYIKATKEISRVLEQKLSRLGLSAPDFTPSYLMRNFDVNEYMNKYFKNTAEQFSIRTPPPDIKLSSEAEIDDLFQRS